MRIRMLLDRKGSPDGVTAVLYKTGEAYELPPALAMPWLAKGYCEQDKMDKGPDETKAGTGKPGRKKRRKGK